MCPPYMWSFPARRAAQGCHRGEEIWVLAESSRARSSPWSHGALPAAPPRHGNAVSTGTVGVMLPDRAVRSQEYLGKDGQDFSWVLVGELG